MHCQKAPIAQLIGMSTLCSLTDETLPSRCETPATHIVGTCAATAAGLPAALLAKCLIALSITVPGDVRSHCKQSIEVVHAEFVRSRPAVVGVAHNTCNKSCVCEDVWYADMAIIVFHALQQNAA